MRNVSQDKQTAESLQFTIFLMHFENILAKGEIDDHPLMIKYMALKSGRDLHQ